MPGATVRISETSRDLLRELASHTDMTMQSVIECALAEYKKRLFWSQAEQDFKAMQGDPNAWKEEIAEREEWDTTLMDGLEAE